MATTDAKLRFSAKRGWMAAVVGYAIARAIIAWSLLSEQGVNPWIFGIIDIGTAFPYASATAELPGAIADGKWSHLARQLVIALLSFFAPYAYLWLASESAPPGLRSGIIVLALVLFFVAAVGIYRRTKKIIVARS